MSKAISAACVLGVIASAMPTAKNGLEDYRSDVTEAIGQLRGGLAGNYSNYGIVGGDIVNPMYKYPFIAGMRSSAAGSSFCGGTLIGREWVLSAAHCAPITWVSVDTFYRSGTTDGQQKQVLQSYTHPDYSDRDLSNDFLLLRIQEVDRVVPASLAAASGGDEPVGRLATVIGWGATRENGATSNELREVNVGIVDQQTCNTALSDYGGVTSSMLCAGGIAGQDACQGDSGGPLVVNGDTLVGDVSWGIGCARAGLPGVYGRISDARSWIDGILSTNGAKANWVEAGL